MPVSMRYDIVGDIHGFGDALKRLLLKLGYQQINGVWQHPQRILISVGDFIDRGPNQVEVVNILRRMQQAGKAIVLLGNHELNAIAWYQMDEHGKPMRAHSAKNLQEHHAFLEQSSHSNDWYLQTINWLKSLPLFFENEHFRCIHAAWHDKHIQQLVAHTEPDNSISPRVWGKTKTITESYHQALEYCLNGPKIRLPEGHFFTDSAGRKRSKMRLKWWDFPRQPTYRNTCISVPNPQELPPLAIDNADKPQVYFDKPIFFGHYWMQGPPVLMNEKVACLDWSVVQKDGVLAAYRYDGESHLQQQKLVWVAQ